MDSVHCSGDMIESARQLHDDGNGFSIHLFALEHRYYGQSYPEFGKHESAVSNKNLVYLSSKQALADLAHFVSSTGKEIEDTYISDTRVRRRLRRFEAPLGVIDKWITFGGSYPGIAKIDTSL